MIKSVAAFFQPLGLAIILAMLGLALLVMGRVRAAAWLLALMVVLLWVCSTPVFANFVLGSLERHYPWEGMAELPSADAMVVMGGGVRRLIHTARLYRAGKAPLIILSGGGQPSEAEVMRGVLAEIGVPAAAMLLDTRSNSTYQNAIHSLQLLRQCGVERILLVTSAAHMRRARAVFRGLGVEVIPAATDHQAGWRSHTLRDWIPSAMSLQRTTAGVREYLAWWWYAFRGWLVSG